MDEPIRLYLVSGFLGAGKTTLMRRLIERFSAERLGVIVNEFGSVGIDGAQLKKGELKLVEINNGSIFCACLKDGFVRTLKAFAQQPIDVLLIENSGMADPSAMASVLAGIAPYLARPYRYMGSVCMVDCATFLDFVDTLTPVQNQVAAAGLVVMNKTDLAGDAVLSEIHARIRALNPQAAVADTTYARLPAGLLEEKLADTGYAAEGANTYGTRPNAYTLLAQGGFTKEQVKNFYAALPKGLLRIKGFVPGETGWLAVQAASGVLRVEAADTAAASDQPAGTARLVLIFTAGGEQAGAITVAWRQHCGAEASVTET